MFERFSNAAREAVVQSQDLARGMDSGLIGEEHLLLTLLNEPTLADLLPVFGPAVPQLPELAGQLRVRLQASAAGHLPFTPQAKQSLQLALRESLSRGENHIGLRYLLLGVLRAAWDEPSQNLVAQMFARVGVDPGEVRLQVLQSLDTIRARQNAVEKQLDAELEAQRRDPDQCVFCRILVEQDEAARVYEDERVLAFLDVRPINTGHALVVPKEHLPYLADVGQELATHIFAVGYRLAAALRASSLRCAGVGLMLNDGAAAGQAIFHAHLHVYPRNPGDGYRINASWWDRERPELDQTAAQLRDILQQSAQHPR